MRVETLLGDADAMRHPARCTVVVMREGSKNRLIGSRHSKLILRVVRDDGRVLKPSLASERQRRGGSCVSCTCIWAEQEGFVPAQPMHWQ